MSGELAELEMVLEETLRMYPPAWIGPRRSVEAFEFNGHTVPAKAFVNYCSWASHHLPDVFEDPAEFRPERFTPEARERIPKGAYVPFGGGSRTCIGMRFGQLEVRAIATLILSRVTLSVPEDFRLEIHQMPTISPKNGLPVTVRPRPEPGLSCRSAERRRDAQPVARDRRVRARADGLQAHARIGEQAQRECLHQEPSGLIEQAAVAGLRDRVHRGAERRTARR